MTLDNVSLNFNEDVTTLHVANFANFLQCCGGRINVLILNCSVKTFLKFEDLLTISQNCPLLDGLEIDNFQIQEEDEVPTIQQQLNFRFLTHLKLRQFSTSNDLAREWCLRLMASCPDLEVLHLAFSDKAWFFSDFLLDEILCLNPLARLESFVIENASLTLISALRLLNCRPKLRRIGRILQWDVELSELETFGQIIKRAKSLNFLHQDVTFL